MANSTLRPGESYEVGTRTKYQNEDVARTYHREFTRFSLSPNDFLVRAVTRGELRAIRACLSAIRSHVTTIGDIPCGTGKLLPLFAEQRCETVAGDVSGEMLAIARKTVTAASFGALFVRLDATSLPFANSSLDAVVCLRLLHRVPTQIKSAIFAELRRVSRRYAIVSYGCSSGWQNVRLRLRRLLTGRLTVPYPITRPEMRDLLKDHGWRVIDEQPVLAMLSAEAVLLLEKL